MALEAVSGSESVQEANRDDQGNEMAAWNGRELRHSNENFSVVFHRAVLHETNAPYVLCKNERDPGSSSNSKQSESRDSKSASNDKDSKSETRQSVYVSAKTSNDHHGKSSNSVSGNYKIRGENKNGTRWELEASVTHERSEFASLDKQNQISDFTSGEVRAGVDF